jgi:exonuclease SbcD
MKVAITADLHLSTKADCPERYNALENILEQVEAQGIEALIVAGDLFDKDFHSYSDFESLCEKYSKIQIHIIPGNHDAGISEKSIVGPNIRIYTAPTPVTLGSATFLFVPYKENTNMSEQITTAADKIKGKNWFLVSHGDYYGGVKELNPLEPGTYMPLSRANVVTFNPKAVFLGHIHKPTDWDNVHYTGSPCGLDITETGKRRFLICDTKNGKVTERAVDTDVVYFDENFLIVPLAKEVPLLKREIAKRIKAWDLDPSEAKKVVVRVKATGYSSDRGSILKALQNGFMGYNYYNGAGPLINELSSSPDIQLNEIAEETIDLINKLVWNFGGDEPDRDLITKEALKVIYGA